MIKYLVLAITLLTVAGCLRSETNIEKRVQVYFSAEGMGEPLGIGSDTLELSEIKLTLTGFSLTTQDSTVIGTSDRVEAILYFYNELAESDVLVISTSLGFEVNHFVGHTLQVGIVPEGSIPFDEDLFEADKTYSLVIKGRLNGEAFTFKSSTSFEKTTESAPIELNNSNEILVIRSSLIMDNLFKDEEGGFLDPTISSNKSLIDANLQASLTTTLSNGSFIF